MECLPSRKIIVQPSDNDIVIERNGCVTATKKLGDQIDAYLPAFQIDGGPGVTPEQIRVVEGVALVLRLQNVRFLRRIANIPGFQEEIDQFKIKKVLLEGFVSRVKHREVLATLPRGVKHLPQLDEGRKDVSGRDDTTNSEHRRKRRRHSRVSDVVDLTAEDHTVIEEEDQKVQATDSSSHSKPREDPLDNLSDDGQHPGQRTSQLSGRPSPSAQMARRQQLSGQHEAIGKYLPMAQNGDAALDSVGFEPEAQTRDQEKAGATLVAAGASLAVPPFHLGHAGTTLLQRSLEPRMVNRVLGASFHSTANTRLPPPIMDATNDSPYFAPVDTTGVPFKTVHDLPEWQFFPVEQLHDVSMLALDEWELVVVPVAEDSEEQRFLLDIAFVRSS